MSGKSVSIILVNYNGKQHLERCLRSVQEYSRGDRTEIIVVDNNSTDGSVEMVKHRFPTVQLIESVDNLGFGRANNLAARHSTGEYLLFLNTDTYLVEDSVDVLVQTLENHAEIGAVGPMLVFADGRFQLSAGALPSLFVELMDKMIYGLDRTVRLLNPLFRLLFCRKRHTGWITGACMMVRRGVFADIGGFDERMFMYYEDKDLCKRMREAGWGILFLPSTTVVHLLGGSAAPLASTITGRWYRESQLHYYRKHLGGFQTALLGMYLKLGGKYPS